MDLTFAILLGALALIYGYHTRARKRSVLNKLPGPPSKSFLLGNMGEFLQSPAGEAEFSWQETYGGVVKLKAPLALDRYMIFDPKALQHILQTSGYRWGNYRERTEMSRMTTGKGVLWSDGDIHKRQKRIMLPCFGASEMKDFLPVFYSCSSTLSRRWTDILSSSKSQTEEFNIPEWISRAALDVIGKAAFDYDFGATDDHETELGKVYQDMVVKAFGAPSAVAMVMLELYHYLPRRLVEYINDHIPSPRLAAIREVSHVADAVVRDLVKEKREELLKGEGKKDVMSRLVKASASANPKAKLSDAELIAQMRDIIFAGHETTANTFSWLLYELVQNTELQSKLRSEIHDLQKLRGDTQLSLQDLEEMPLLNATIKETLRFHPVALHIFRHADQDDVLPLETPITTTTGEVVTELPIPKGTRVILALPTYNRNKKLFGEDAHKFNPYRWLEPDHVKKGITSLGPISNLATFSAGIRTCPGWRFAVTQLHAFAVEFIGNFEFSATPKIQKIRREQALAMIPTVEGEIELGPQLPLKVTIARREDEA